VPKIVTPGLSQRGGRARTDAIKIVDGLAVMPASRAMARR